MKHDSGQMKFGLHINSSITKKHYDSERDQFPYLGHKVLLCSHPHLVYCQSMGTARESVNRLRQVSFLKSHTAPRIVCYDSPSFFCRKFVNGTKSSFLFVELPR